MHRTERAPAASSASVPERNVAPVVTTSSTRSTVPRTLRRARKVGPSSRSARDLPVCGPRGSSTRSSRRRQGTASRHATARANSSAWSYPRRRRRSPEVGAHVTTSTCSCRTCRAIARANDRTTGRALPYLRASTRRRPPPENERTAGTGANAGADSTVAAHRTQGASPGRRQIGHWTGSSTPPVYRRGVAGFRLSTGSAPPCTGRPAPHRGRRPARRRAASA
jgi:hypothetical protein